MPFQAIETQRLYQQVARQVAGLIRGGELAPGDRLPPERDLAKRLGVSRPTLREAMIALEIAGLVEVRVGSGIFVRTPAEPPARVIEPIATGERGADGEDAATFDAGPSPTELIDARLMIEPAIAAQAALNATAEDDAAIEATVRDLEIAADRIGREAADRRFHTLIAVAARNSVLAGVIDGFWAGMALPMFAAISDQTGLPEIHAATVADHRAIQKAIAERSPERAEAAMRAHLGHVRAVLDRLDNGDETASRPQAAARG